MSEITFQDYDKFERKNFADRLTKIIKTFYPFYDEAFVLSLNAKYGSGKTTFLEMWQKELQDDGHEVIYINSWKTDFDEEPLIPIISTILSEIDKKSGKKTKAIKTLEKTLQGALGASALAVDQTSKKLIGISPEDLINRAKSDFNYGDLKKIGKTIYREYGYKEDAYSELHTALKNYIDTLQNKPLFIFIDELDRVRPNYAIEFLEAIKHIFSIHGVCFVIAVDKDQLECATRHIYGNIDFKNYFLRFITREANLPDISGIDLLPFIENLANEFFDEKRTKGVCFPFQTDDQKKLTNLIGIICRAHGFTGRQTKTFFRIFSQYMAINSEITYEYTAWIRCAVYLIALSLYDTQLYKSLGTGKLSPNEIEQYISNLDFSFPNRNKNLKYAVRDIFSLTIKNHEDDNKTKREHQEIADIILKYYPNISVQDNIDASRQKAIEMIAKDDYSVGIQTTSTFEKMYKDLEEWKTFID